MAGKLANFSLALIFLITGQAYNPLVAATSAAVSATCPTGCPLARSQGYYKTHCSPAGTLTCNQCASSSSFSAAASTIASKCNKATIGACVTETANSCWTQLTALLLNAAGCDSLVKTAALYSPLTIIKDYPTCSYFGSAKSITLQDMFTASLQKATKTTADCTAVKDCLGKVLGDLDKSTSYGVPACPSGWLSCNVKSCTTGGTGCDDPIFIGFNNYRYAFHGRSGNVYSIFSEEETQVNAQMASVSEVDDRLSGPATYMGAATVQHHADRVLVRSEFGSKIEVVVNGVLLELSDLRSPSQLTMPDGTKVKLWSKRRHVPDTVQVATPKLTVIFSGQGHHLDIHIVRVSSGMCDVHGVLGQTYYGTEYDQQRPAPDSFAIQGNDVDYQVNGLFATDSKFNRFGKQPAHCYEHLTKGSTTVGTLPLATAARKMLTVRGGCIGVFGNGQGVSQCLTAP